MADVSLPISVGSWLDAGPLRRKGVGTGLLHFVERACTTVTIFVSTNLSNLPMQGLLTKSGYQLAGVVEGLDEGDPELFYRKRLRFPKE
jgi:hypothetical protein